MSKRQKPQWTIMVYLACNNDLTSHCVSVLQQLQSVRYPDDVCVLACFESSTPWPRGSRYLEVNCSHSRAREKEVFFDWEMHNDLIPPDSNGEEDPNANGNGSVNRPVVTEGLRKFINFGVSRHRDSEHFMLILFGHGPLVAGQTFLVSENPGGFVRLEDLKEVLSEHFGEDKRKLDILAFQNCVMNGIETAYEIRNQADFVIGSQGLVLATGWPYEKMIQAVARSRSDASTSTIARKVLKVCARNMLDFTIMDRSSEQSACNLAALRDSSTIPALRSLVKALEEGMKFDVDKKERGREQRFLVYPEIVDAIRLARLEAQSYWWEMFVDLYDFCERLVQKCNELVKRQDRLLVEFEIEGDQRSQLANKPLVQQTKAIVACCIDVMAEIRELVPSSHSYYIGSELQYSHGLSIYFPWSFPVGPYFPRPTRTSKEYRLETAFHTYSQYSFVKQSNWDKFLDAFFNATLRNMRRANRTFEMKKDLTTLEAGLTFPRFENPGHVALTSDLQKSSPDTARADVDMSFNIKNYPRRNYLSPADEERKEVEAAAINAGEDDFPHPDAPPASALGWNFPTLVAEVIRKRKPGRKRQQKSRGGKASGKVASPKSSRKGESESDAGNAFERAASQKSSRNSQPNVGAANPLAKVASPRNT